MNNPIPFTFNNTDNIRVLDVCGEPMFVASDVCGVLGLSNPSMAIQSLDDDEVTLSTIEGSHRPTNIVNESGLYALIFKSRKKVAKVFRKWVTSEVLPSIRKTSSYSTSKLPNFNNPVEAARAWADSEEQKQVAQTALIEAQPKIQFAEAVNDSINCVTIQDFAKAVGTGQNRFFSQLRQDAYVQSRTGQRNKPYQKYVDQGLFKLCEKTFKNSRSGEIETYFRTLLTPKGQMYFTNKYFNQQSEAV